MLQGLSSAISLFLRFFSRSLPGKTKLGLGLLILILAGCQPEGPQNPPPLASPRLAPLPQDGFVQVFFNQAQSADYTDPYRHQSRAGDNLEQEMIQAIAQAKTSIDVAVQELRLPALAQALVDRQRAGIKVRLILEHKYSQPLSSLTPAAVAQLPEREQSRYQEFRQLVDLDGDGHLSADEIRQRDALVIVQQAGIPWVDDTADGSAGSNLMHHKFVVIDGQRTIVTSANFTLSDIHGDFKHPSSRGNANNLLKIESPALAKLFTQEFNLMWGDGPGGKPDSKFGVNKPFRPAQTIPVGNGTITVQFSPVSRQAPWSQSGNGLIDRALQGAQQSIDLALFVFSEQALANTLEKQHQQGRSLRVLLDPSFAFRPYSEGLDLLGIAVPQDCKVESGNRPWSQPLTTVGTPKLPPGDLLHHKFAIIDRQWVITGSHNWSSAANHGNDETLVVIQNPLVAAHFHREFERLYQGASLGLPPTVHRKLAQGKHQACSPLPNGS